MLCASSSPPLYAAERRKAKPAVPPLSRCLTGLQGGTRPASSTHIHAHTHADTSIHSLNLKLQRQTEKHKDTSSLNFTDKGWGHAWLSMQILGYWDAQCYKNRLNKLKQYALYSVIHPCVQCYICAISERKPASCGISFFLEKSRYNRSLHQVPRCWHLVPEGTLKYSTFPFGRSSIIYSNKYCGA